MGASRCAPGEGRLCVKECRVNRGQARCGDRTLAADSWLRWAYLHPRNWHVVPVRACLFGEPATGVTAAEQQGGARFVERALSHSG